MVNSIKLYRNFDIAFHGEIKFNIGIINSMRFLSRISWYIGLGDNQIFTSCPSFSILYTWYIESTTENIKYVIYKWRNIFNKNSLRAIASIPLKKAWNAIVIH